MWLSTDSTTVVDVSLFTRILDVDFNVLTGFVDLSLLTQVYPLIFYLPPPGIFIIDGGS